MRNLSILRSPYCGGFLISLAFLALSGGFTLAQDATPIGDTPIGVSKMPKDAKELIILAAKDNDLVGVDVQPWHLRASLTEFDGEGNVKGKETYEEFWVSQRKYKVVRTSSDYSQTEYGTGAGIMRAGARNLPPALYRRAMSELTNPIQVNDQLLEHWILGREKRDQDGIKLLCVEVKGWSTPSGSRNFDGPAFCLDADRPMLRFDTNPVDPTRWLRSNFLDFEGHYLPSDLEAVREGKTLFKAHLDKIEALKTVSEADFTPTPDAVAVVLKVNISGGVAQSMLVKNPAPVYPVEAKQAGISGTVILQATIGKDGHVAEIKVISGPIELQQAALDAVRTWAYKPYLLNGDPVTVDTTVNVVFTLGR